MLLHCSFQCGFCWCPICLGGDQGFLGYVSYPMTSVSLRMRLGPAADVIAVRIRIRLALVLPISAMNLYFLRDNTTSRCESFGLPYRFHGLLGSGEFLAWWSAFTIWLRVFFGLSVSGARRNPKELLLEPLLVCFAGSVVRGHNFGEVSCHMFVCLGFWSPPRTRSVPLAVEVKGRSGDHRNGFFGVLVALSSFTWVLRKEAGPRVLV